MSGHRYCTQSLLSVGCARIRGLLDIPFCSAVEFDSANSNSRGRCLQAPCRWGTLIDPAIVCHSPHKRSDEQSLDRSTHAPSSRGNAVEADFSDTPWDARQTTKEKSADSSPPLDISARYAWVLILRPTMAMSTWGGIGRFPAATWQHTAGSTQTDTYGNAPANAAAGGRWGMIASSMQASTDQSKGLLGWTCRSA